MVTINGYTVRNISPGIVKIEGKSPCSYEEAREILGINRIKRVLDMQEQLFRKETSYG